MHSSIPCIHPSKYPTIHPSKPPCVPRTKTGPVLGPGLLVPGHLAQHPAALWARHHQPKPLGLVPAAQKPRDAWSFAASKVVSSPAHVLAKPDRGLRYEDSPLKKHEDNHPEKMPNHSRNEFIVGTPGCWFLGRKSPPSFQLPTLRALNLAWGNISAFSQKSAHGDHSKTCWFGFLSASNAYDIK